MCSFGRNICRFLHPRHMYGLRLYKNNLARFTQTGCLQLRPMCFPVNKPDVPDLMHFQRRAVHQTNCLLKKQKFDPHLYERVNILDRKGHFLIECELLVLKEFCNKFNRFTYEKFESEEPHHKVDKHHINPDLDIYHLDEKYPISDSKTRKIVKMNMKELMTFKVEKVIQELLDHGSVTLQYKKGPQFYEFLQLIDKYGKVSLTDMQDRKSEIAVIYAKPLTPELLTDLLSNIHAKEKSHIDDVVEMLKVVEE